MSKPNLKFKWHECPIYLLDTEGSSFSDIVIEPYPRDGTPLGYNLMINESYIASYDRLEDAKIAAEQVVFALETNIKKV